MPIVHLQALRAVLSQTCNVICDIYDITKEEAFSRIQKYIQENSTAWRSEDTPAINYHDPFCRMAYLYMNVAVHAYLMQGALEGFPQLRDMLQTNSKEDKEFRICSLGGGPGSELLGVISFLEQQNIERIKCDFLIVDRINEWDESWYALKNGLDDQLKTGKKLDARISRSFLSLDVTDFKHFKSFPTRFNDSDIFIASYLVSELKGLEEPFLETLKFIKSRLGQASYFLFIDRDQSNVRKKVHWLIAELELKLLGEHSLRGKLHEDLGALGEWFINIPTLPRHTWSAFAILAQKI